MTGLKSFINYNKIHHVLPLFSFFFFNDTATTEIYTLSLHDALPILGKLTVLSAVGAAGFVAIVWALLGTRVADPRTDRKSTRLNSSHTVISYAVFCLKKKKTPPRLRR